MNGAPERAWSGSATGQRACPLGLRMPLTIEQGERQGPWRPLGGVSAGSCRLAGVGPSGPIQMAATHKRTNLPAESGKCEAKARSFKFTQPPAADSPHCTHKVLNMYCTYTTSSRTASFTIPLYRSCLARWGSASLMLLTKASGMHNITRPEALPAQATRHPGF